MKLMKKIIFLLSFLFLSFISFGVESIKSGSWDNPSTWDCNCIPGNYHNVKINAGHTVTLASNPTKVRHLTIDGALKFPNNPSVYLMVYGNIIINNGGKVVGSAYIRYMANFNAKIYNNSSSIFRIIDFRRERTYDVEFRSGNFEIVRELNVIAGGSVTVNPNATVVLSSGNITARVISDGAVYGTFVVERYISARPADYADLASPVTNTTFNDWDQELYMSGVNGNDGNACYDPNCDSIYYSVYTWNNLAQKYDTVTNVTQSIPFGFGVELFLGDNLNNYNGGKFNSIGTLHFGNFTLNSLQLNSTPGKWNFLGNPYQAWINWNNVSKSGLKNEVWIYDAVSSSYKLYSGSNILIPPSQGFWVQTNGSSPSCTYTESSKYISASSNFYRISDDNEAIAPEPLVSDEVLANVREYLANETEIYIKDLISGYRNQAYLRYTEDASLSFDEFDATTLKLKNLLAPEIYTISMDNHNLALNCFEGESVVIPLVVKAKFDGIYEIGLNNLNHLSLYYDEIKLKDPENNTVYDLNAIPGVKLNLNENQQKSLTLILNKKSQYSSFQTFDKNTVNIYRGHESIIIDNLDAKNKYHISVYNLLGQLLYSNQISGQNRLTIPSSIKMNNTESIYILNIENNGKTETHKIVF